MYSIVNSHKDYINVHSIINEETKFTIYLPCCIETAKRKRKKEPAKTTISKGRIYLIDDEEMNGDVGKKILLRWRHEVTLFNNFEADLLALTHCIDEVNIVITDETIPVMTRLTASRTCNRTRQKNANYHCQWQSVDPRLN